MIRYETSTSVTFDPISEAEREAEEAFLAEVPCFFFTELPDGRYCEDLSEYLPEFSEYTRYIVQRLPIFSGGQAHLFLAYDRKLRREVIIKRMRVERAHKEASVHASFFHFQNLRLLDYFAIGEMGYIVTEYIDPAKGSNFGDYLFSYQGEMAPAQSATLALAFAQQIGLTLQDFYERAGYRSSEAKNGPPHMLWMDIKPDNILIEHIPATDAWYFRMLDFGIAESEDNIPQPTDYEEEMEIEQFPTKGSLQFLAPERARYICSTRDQAYSGEITLQSEMFSFGIVLLEIITGMNLYEQGKPLTHKEISSIILTYTGLPGEFLEPLRTFCEHTNRDPAKLIKFFARTLHLNSRQRWPDFITLVTEFEEAMQVQSLR